MKMEAVSQRDREVVDRPFVVMARSIDGNWRQCCVAEEYKWAHGEGDQVCFTERESIVVFKTAKDLIDAEGGEDDVLIFRDVTPDYDLDGSED